MSSLHLFHRRDFSVLGQWWWTVDRLSLALLVVLILLGSLLVALASPPVAERIGLASHHFTLKHGVFTIPALITILAVSLMPERIIRRTGVLVFLGLLVVLVGTLVFAPDIKGAQRWISVAGFSVQPSEFIKPAFAISSAWLLSLKHQHPNQPTALYSFAIMALTLGLLMLQPDLGQSIIIFASWFTQLFIAGLSIQLTLGFMALGGAIVALAYVLLPHVQTRVDLFLQGEVANNYQAAQSLKALGSGGWLGTGPGEGQIKSHLPDGHADFIFAVAGEEMGFIICAVIIAHLAVITVRSLWRIGGHRDPFAIYAVVGLACQIAFQSLINLASTLHLIPTKGMTLPFLSYGGSSMLALALTAGAMLALTRKSDEVR